MNRGQGKVPVDDGFREICYFSEVLLMYMLDMGMSLHICLLGLGQLMR
jgi:hypothetical protein